MRNVGEDARRPTLAKREAQQTRIEIRSLTREAVAAYLWNGRARVNYSRKFRLPRTEEIAFQPRAEATLPLDMGEPNRRANGDRREHACQGKQRDELV